VNTKESDMQKMDLNRASKEDLMQAQGISERLAEILIEFREQHGPVRDWEEIREVDGFSDQRLRILQENFTLGGNGGTRRSSRARGAGEEGGAARSSRSSRDEAEEGDGGRGRRRQQE
jgi:hypothetical protein